jgi:hypothetical protein
MFNISGDACLQLLASTQQKRGDDPIRRVSGGDAAIR